MLPTLRSPLLVFVLIVSLLLVACSRPAEQPTATPVPVRETVIVIQTVVAQETVIVRETVQVPVTVVVTTTSEPTPTPLPEPSPEPTASVAAPEGWNEYRSISDRFATWYSPKWKVVSEDTLSVTFDLGRFGGASMLVQPASWGPTGDEKRVNRLVEDISDSQDSLDTVRLMSKGSFDSPMSCDYVALTIRDYVYENTSHEIWLRCPNAKGQDIHAYVYRISDSPTEEEIANLKIMAALTTVK